MSKVWINGTLSPIAQPTEVDFDPVRGLIMHLEFHSAGDNLSGVAQMCINQNIAFNWHRSPIRSTIVYTISGGQGGLQDVPQVNWELLGNEIQESIFDSGIAIAGEAIKPGFCAIVQKFYDDLVAGEVTMDDPYPTALTAGLGPGAEFDKLRGYFAQILNLLRANQTHFPQGQYVLKRTGSISNFYDRPIDGEELTETLIPMDAILNYPMPRVMRAKLSSIKTPSELGEGYVWAWRQLPSRMVTSAQNRVEVSTEWWLYRWFENLYRSTSPF